MRGDELKLARAAAHRGDDARKPAVAEDHDLRINERPSREHRDPKVVGPRTDDAVGEKIAERVECLGPRGIDLEHGDDVGAAIAEVGERRSGVVVDATHVHRDHEDLTVTSRSRDAGGGQRFGGQPVGQHLADVAECRQDEADGRGRPRPADTGHKAADGEQQPGGAEVAREIE